MPETDDHCRVDNDFGGADIDDISDDYPILDDGSRDDDASLDDDLAALNDDINAIVNHFYDAGPDHDLVFFVDSDEPHPRDVDQ